MSARELLLVEDSPDDEALMLRAFRHHGFDVRISVAHDGVEALERLFGPEAHRHPLPVLIMLDLMMPRVDGFQVLERLRADARTRTVPVVIFSSSNEPGDVQRGYALGASSFVRKPVDFDEFSEAIRRVGEFWLSLNLLPTPPVGRAASAQPSGAPAVPSG